MNIKDFEKFTGVGDRHMLAIYAELDRLEFQPREAVLALMLAAVTISREFYREDSGALRTMLITTIDLFLKASDPAHTAETTPDDQVH